MKQEARKGAGYLIDMPNLETTSHRCSHGSTRKKNVMIQELERVGEDWRAIELVEGELCHLLLP